MTTTYQQETPDEIKEGCGVVLMARVFGWDGSLITKATLASITYKIIDLDDSRVVDSGSLVVADVVFDAAQEDGSWRFDDGYNFRWLIPGESFDKGGHEYKAEATFVPSGSENEPFAVDRYFIAENRH